MKRLQDNLNSSYIALANKLRPKDARQKIVAYVESYDDVFFWRTVLQDFETERFYFEVMLPSRTTLSRGKKQALMNRLGSNLGEHMIACVDADYDWLMQGRTEMSEFVCANPYVLHTYAYAIENYQCYAPALHASCVMSTLNDRSIIDLEAFIEEYSRIIWPLFVWSVLAYRKGRFKEFSLSMFADAVSYHDVNLYHPEQTLEQVRKRVNHTIGWLQQRKFPGEKRPYHALKEELLALGIVPEHTYLYIQGHTLFDNVVMPLLAPICNVLRREREREINQLAVHQTQKQNELSSYQHSQQPVEMMLRKATGFKESVPYQWLKADITRLMTEVARHEK